MNSNNNKLGYISIAISLLLWKLDIGILWVGLGLLGLGILLLPKKTGYVSPNNKIVFITGESSFMCYEYNLQFNIHFS